jgi:pyruvate dehydrogenase E2 component (dihydrolipoamide acetyltransferase)
LRAGAVPHDINIGFATGAEDSLHLPVVKRADKLTVEEIAAETKELTAGVENRQISEQEMGGGMFVATSFGMCCVESLGAIIVPCQVGALSVGAVVERPACGEADRRHWQPKHGPQTERRSSRR